MGGHRAAGYRKTSWHCAHDLKNSLQSTKHYSNDALLFLKKTEKEKKHETNDEIILYKSSQCVQYYSNNTLRFVLQLVKYALNNTLQFSKYDFGAITFPHWWSNIYKL